MTVPERPTTSIPVRRKLMYGLVIVIAFFVLLEIGLRLVGYTGETRSTTALEVYGDPPKPFTLKPGPDGTKTVSTNTAETFRPGTFLIPKPPGEQRVFCFGGSATFGSQVTTEETYSPRLQKQLQNRLDDSDSKVNVINLGRPALESFRIKHLVKEIIDGFEADLLVLYTGHNDYINVLRIDDILTIEKLSRTSLKRRLKIIRLLSPSRVFQLLEQLVWASRRTLEKTITYDEYVQAKRQVFRMAEAGFKDNIEDIILMARKADIPVLLCTVASITYGCPPFNSALPGKLSHSDWGALLDLNDQIVFRLWQNRPQEAVEIAQTTLQINPRNAHLLYLYGSALFNSGRFDEAKAALQSARDEDISGRRAPGNVNRILKELVQLYSIPLADIERAFQDRCRNGIIDDSLFIDPIHPSPEGHRVIAETLAKTIIDSGILSVRDR